MSTDLQRVQLPVIASLLCEPALRDFNNLFDDGNFHCAIIRMKL